MPALRVAHVADRNEVLNDRSKIERGAHDKKTLRPSEPFELDCKRPPHVAARTVGSDQPPAGLERARFRALDLGGNTRIALRHPHDPRMKLQVEGGIVAQQVAKDARELRLLAL